MKNSFWRLGSVGFIILLAALVFRPWRPAEFLLWDDDLHVTGNPLLHPVNWKHFLEIWAHSYGSLYIPVTYSLWSGLVYLVQTFFGDGWAAENITWPFLTLNLVVHLINAVLVYRFLQKSSASWAWSALGAILFLFHPVQVEPVVTVTGLKELLWVTFALATLLSYLDGRPRAVLLFFALAILSKPTAAVLPFILLALDGVREKPALGSYRFPVLSILFFESMLILGATKRFQADQFVTETRPIGARVFIAMDSIGFYFKKLLQPYPVILDYGRTPSWVLEHLPTRQILLFFAAVALAGFILWRYPSSRRRAILVLSVLVMPLLPVSGIVPFLQQNYSTVADHYLYFSVLGLGLIVGYGGPRWVFALLSALVALSIGYSYHQSDVWTTNERLFSYILRKNPNSFMAENNLGIVSARKGDDAVALKHFERSYEINPRDASAAKNMGITLTKLGRIEEAAIHYRKLLDRDPGLVAIHIDYGYLLYNQNHFEEALAQFDSAIHLDSHNTTARLYAGITLCRLKRCREAVPHFEAIVASEPENRLYHDYLQKALESK